MNNSVYKALQRIPGCGQLAGGQVVTIAESHGVLPLLDQDAGEPESTDYPDELLKAVAVAAATSKRIQARRRGVIRDLFRNFGECGIEALVFKGGANAYLLYATPGLRPHADIDILIRENDFDVAQKIFQEAGYRQDGFRPTRFGPFQSMAILDNEKTPPVVFDIHWKINNRLVLADVIGFSELSKNAVEIEACGPGVKGPGLEDAMLVACLHEAGGLPWEKGRLISLYDMLLLMGKLGKEGIDSCARRSIRKGIGEIFISAIDKAAIAFGDERQTHMVTDLKSRHRFFRNELSAVLLRESRSWLDDQLLDLKAVHGFRSKSGFLASKLVNKLGLKATL